MSGFDWRTVKVGDTFRVKAGSMSRAGMYGTVVAYFDGRHLTDEPQANKDDVALDFYCDVFGDKKGLPTIEQWSWDELEVDDA